MSKISPAWKLIEGKRLEREFKLKNFAQALELVNKIGKIAEEEGHHPDLLLAWGKVKVTLFTHKIGGLSENDFIMAARIDGVQG